MEKKGKNLSKFAVLNKHFSYSQLTLAPEDRRNISALQHPQTFKKFAEYFQVKGNPLNIQAETWVEYFKTAWVTPPKTSPLIQ